MAFMKNCLVLLAIATVGYCYGAVPSDEEKCNEFQSAVVCENKPPSYVLHQDNINTNLNKNKDFLGLYSRQGMLNSDRKDLVISGDNDNCKAHTQTITPYVMKFENATYYVPQTQTLTQQIKITRCLYPNTMCFTNIFGYNHKKTSCREKTAATSLFVYDPENNTIVFKSFNIPVACTCMMSSDRN